MDQADNTNQDIEPTEVNGNLSVNNPKLQPNQITPDQSIPISTAMPQPTTVAPNMVQQVSALNQPTAQQINISQGVNNNYQQSPSHPTSTPQPGPRKARSILVIIGAVFTVLVILSTLAFAGVKFLSNKEFTGNYNNLISHSYNNDVTASGGFQFLVPATMTENRKDIGKVEFQQITPEKQILKSNDGWESIITASGKSAGSNDEIIKGFKDEGNSIGRLSYVQIIVNNFIKILEDQEYKDTSASVRDDLSDYDNAKVVMDYTYTETGSSQSISGRRIIIFRPDSTYNFDIKAVTKLWNKNFVNFDQISLSFKEST